MRGSLMVLSVVLLLGACGTEPASAPDDDTGGMGVPQQFPSEDFPGERRSMTTRVEVAENGCFLGSPRGAESAGPFLVVWPTKTRLGSVGNELRLPDGTTIRAGDVLSGDGLLMPTRDLERFGGDGYWDYAVGFCTPGAREVLVLDSVDAVGRARP